MKDSICKNLKDVVKYKDLKEKEYTDEEK